MAVMGRADCGKVIGIQKENRVNMHFSENHMIIIKFQFAKEMPYNYFGIYYFLKHFEFIVA